MTHLPEIRLTRENVMNELPKLIHAIKPSWDKDNTEIKKIGGGFSCLMYSCFAKGNPVDGVTVRAKNFKSKDFPNIKDAVYESTVLQAMNSNGLFPEVLATFENGFCYQYIKGKPLYGFTNDTVVLEEPVMRLMARRLAEMHSVKVEGFDYLKPDFFEPVYKILHEKYPVDKLPTGLPTREEMLRELKLVEGHAVKAGCPIVTCHGDPHPGNIVHDSEAGCVTYVDWELSHVGYQASDLGNVFEILTTFNVKMPDNFCRKYLRYYLEKWFEIKGKTASEVTEDDVDKLEKQANLFRLCALLMWVSLMTILFAVDKPEHLTVEDMKKLQSNVAKDKRQPSNTDDTASAEQVSTDIVVNIYRKYLEKKDEILSNSNFS